MTGRRLARWGLLALAWGGSLLSAGRARGQQVSPFTATGIFHPTNKGVDNKSVDANGNRMIARDGGVWFLESNADRIAFFKGGVFTEWQVRDNKQLGATPVDFELDGSRVWFIASGQSLIEPGESIYGRLDTATGELTEWVLPISRPAGFVREGADRVWIAMSQGTLELLDLKTREVTDYRTQNSFAFSSIARHPDGSVWLTDFANNRIFRFEGSGATVTAKSWEPADPRVIVLSPAQASFDEQGRLWISEFRASTMDRFDPATQTLDVFAAGFLSTPNRFVLSDGFVYLTESSIGAARFGRVVVLNPAGTSHGSKKLEATVENVGFVKKKAFVRTSTVTPQTFNSTPADIKQDELASTSLGGVSRMVFPNPGAFGLAIGGGRIWVGTSERIGEFVLQPSPSDLDLAVPFAANAGGSTSTRPRTDLTLFNRGGSPLTVGAIFYTSPGPAPSSGNYTLQPGEVKTIADAFGTGGFALGDSLGPVRFHVTSGSPGDLAAATRTYAAREDGGTYGFSAVATNVARSVGPGSSARLFLGTEEGEVSILGLYTLNGAVGTATLLAPDGSVRGGFDFNLAPNQRKEFNPAFSGFGAAAEPGDTVLIRVTTGSLLPYGAIVEPVSGDVIFSPALASPGVDWVFPAAGRAEGAFSALYSSDLLVANSSSSTEARVALALYPTNSAAAPHVASLTVPPGGSRLVRDLLATVFGLSSGQGSVLLVSNSPVAAALRIVGCASDGDYATLALGVSPAEVVTGGVEEAASLVGVASTETRRSNLFLFNRGAAGTVRLVGYGPTGQEVGRSTLPIGDHQSLRIDAVFPFLGVPAIDPGRVSLTVDPGMQLYAWSASADNTTGDAEVQAPINSVP